MYTHPDQFSSGSTQSITYSMFRTAMPRTNMDGILNPCPGCGVTPFPTAWTMEQLGCTQCKLLFPRSMLVQSDFFPDPAPTSVPVMPLDRPASPCTCSFQNRSGKGKSPQTRGRRSVKVPSSPAKELQCCPSINSGNPSPQCEHSSCFPPPNVGLLSRRFDENEKWKRARREAVASFSYENCGCMSTHLASCRFPSFTNQR